MRARASVFDSVAEANVFRSLQGFWEPEYRVHLHLPFVNLVEIDLDSLPEERRNFFLKTSVDFVLTDRAEKPVLAIEFDGLAEGFSNDGHYFMGKEPHKGSSRSFTMGLKLHAARTAKIPMVAIATPETKSFDRETGLALIHGLIGDFLAERHRWDKAHGPFLTDEEQEHLRSLDAEEQYAYGERKFAREEAAREMRWNPVSRLHGELIVELMRVFEKRITFGHGPVRTKGQWLRCQGFVETPRGIVRRMIGMRQVSYDGHRCAHVLREAVQAAAMRDALRIWGN